MSDEEKARKRGQGQFIANLLFANRERGLTRQEMEQAASSEFPAAKASKVDEVLGQTAQAGILVTTAGHDGQAMYSLTEEFKIQSTTPLSARNFWVWNGKESLRMTGADVRRMMKEENLTPETVQVHPTGAKEDWMTAAEAGLTLTRKQSTRFSTPPPTPPPLAIAG